MSSAKQQQGISFTIYVIVAVMACMLGIYFAQHWPEKAHYKYAGTVLNEKREVAPFKLSGSNGKPFTNASLSGKWTLMFFGFTNCGMMCPTAMAQLAMTYQQLQQKHVSPLPQVVMVSVDPDRDTVSKMGSYVTSFNKNFMGAVGPSAEVKALSQQLGIAYEKVALGSKGGKNYDVQHSGAVIVFDPQGQVTAFFNWPLKVSDLVGDYSHLVISR